jgi:anti-anti-sigma factor
MVITSRTVGDVIIFDLDGEFSRDGCPRPNLHELVKAKLGAGEKKILINLEKAEFEDDFAIGQILASLVSTKQISGTLKLSVLSARWQDIMIKTGCNRVIDIYPSEEAALESFATP